MMTDYLVLLAVLLAGMGVLAAGAGARRALAPADPQDTKARSYESGVDPVGQGWNQGSVRYFGYALLYVVLAVDVVYLFPWALVLHSDLGAASAVEMLIFVGVIVVGVAHAWRRGVLRWL